MPASGDPLARMRSAMVDRDIAARGITEPLVLDAMRSVQRENFVDVLDRGSAYADHPLSIGSGQTISQPYIVAFMTQALSLSGSERVLEIGTGSGYQAAVLAEIAAEVFTVERIPDLADRARVALDHSGYANIRFAVRDGSLGWPEHA
ncbi:MAG: protein-L-isoaspartate O-methyltransferase, partial [Planctomycetes bacterium]|nr:protein-L-isoaspartate O-methyltransferase [Planctomycetota bacterium]